MLPPLVTNNMQAVVRRLNDLTSIIGGISGDGKTVRVSKLGSGGITISAKLQQSPQQDGASPSSYTGPWAVVKKNDTTVTIKAQGTGYPFVSRVIAGLITTTMASDTDLTITTNGEVYLHLTVSGSTYTIAFANAATLPAQTAGHFYKSLARVEFADSKIGAITQLVTDDIHVSGRIV